MTESFIVTDIGYGDAGKGTTVDYLARRAASSVVVRHSGGAQAAHNVVTPDGRHHTFAQFGSGSFVPGSRTFLSRFMMINPSMMLAEAGSLANVGVEDIFERTTIDRDALILTPWHAGGNQLREIGRGAAAHGSCGVGIGELQMDLLDNPALVLRAGDIFDGKALKLRLRAVAKAKVAGLRETLGLPDSREADKIWQWMESGTLIDDLLDDYAAWRASGIFVADGSELAALASDTDSLVFEGSQGVLLDEWYGFHPHTTWSTTTSENAETLLEEIGFAGPVTRLGVMRAYATRHGAGPFVTEDPALGSIVPELHNGFGRWMGAFRYGHADFVAHRYAIEATGGIDGLVVTGLDRVKDWQYCNEYEVLAAAARSDFFDFNEAGRAVRMRLGVKGDLDYQERLGQLLSTSCVPRYESLASADDSQLLATIEDALGVRVNLASFGPSASEKVPGGALALL